MGKSGRYTNLSHEKFPPKKKRFKLQEVSPLEDGGVVNLIKKRMYDEGS